MKEEKKTLKVNAQHMSVLSSNAKAKEVISFISFCKVLLPSVRDSAASRGVAHARCLLPPFQFFFRLSWLLFFIWFQSWLVPSSGLFPVNERILGCSCRGFCGSKSDSNEITFTIERQGELSLNDYGRLWPPVRSGSERIVWTTICFSCTGIYYLSM